MALLVEVGAHARWITGLDLAPEQGLLLSVSEDSFAKIWQIKKSEQTVSKCLPNTNESHKCKSRNPSIIFLFNKLHTRINVNLALMWQ